MQGSKGTPGKRMRRSAAIAVVAALALVMAACSAGALKFWVMNAANLAGFWPPLLSCNTSAADCQPSSVVFTAALVP